MKMTYIAALVAGTALVSTGAVAQQNAATDNTQDQAAQTGQASPGMDRVQALIQQALNALNNGDVKAARQAVQSARRQLKQQAQNGNRNSALAQVRQPLRQASHALSNQDTQTAEQALNRAEQRMANTDQQAHQNSASAGADVVVDQSGAAIRMKVPEPNVTVQQPAPKVAVRQQQPVIIVHQPAPTVNVEIPQPQITVRMPKPDVNVSQAQPKVEVHQGEPQVRVSKSQPQVHTNKAEQQQANVQIQALGQPDIKMQGSDQKPVVRYESEKAQVNVSRAQGKPEVRYEQQNNQQAQNGQAERTAQQQANANSDNQANANSASQANANSDNGVDNEQTAAVSQNQARDNATTAVAAGSSRDVQLTVGDIKDFKIVGANGNELGDIEAVDKVNGRLYAVVTSGGFFGLGANRAAVPLSALYVTKQKTLLAPDVTKRKIDGMSNFDSSKYPDLHDDQTVTLGAR